MKGFAQAGSLTLGGNVSVAAGPIGRNAEAAGAASLRSVAGIFSYSKTKGLFAGVSLEGSAIIERRDANEKLYGTRYTAQQLLTGSVRPPTQAAPLMNVLNSRVFGGMRSGSVSDSMYNDVPVYDSSHDDVVWDGRRGDAYGENVQRPASNDGPDYRDDRYDRSSSWRGAGPGDELDREFSRPSRASTYAGSDRKDALGSPTMGSAPGRPAAPKPNFGAKQAMLKKNEAVALYTFEADQPGDLGFKKGEIITVLKKTESDNDWW